MLKLPPVISHELHRGAPYQFLETVVEREKITRPARTEGRGLRAAKAKRLAREITSKLFPTTGIEGTSPHGLPQYSIPISDDYEIAAAYGTPLEEASIGCNFYDAFETAPGRLALAIGHVSKEDINRAVMLQQMLREALFSIRPIGCALYDLNGILAANNLLADFATVFVAVYDVKTRRLEYVSCGHGPAIIARSGNPTRVEMLMPTGPMLGLSANLSFECETRKLSPGDGIVIYTDNHFEFGAKRCETLTAARLMQMVRDNYQGSSADELAWGIYEDEYLRHSITPSDDACLLVSRFGAR